MPRRSACSRFSRSLAVGAQFGVVIVIGERERTSRSGDVSLRRRLFRRAASGQVVYSKSAEEDVRRRDFTINALLLDPETGEVLDFVGGREDLEAGIIRAIGEPEERFREDKLRMVRAVRFAARFGYRDRAGNFRGDRRSWRRRFARCPPSAFATN